MIAAMKRREFITLLGGAAAWPLTARAQQPERMRRVGVLMAYRPSDPEMQARVQALQQELQRLGWTKGVNIQFDERWTTDDMELVRAHAVNLVGTQSGRHRHHWWPRRSNIHSTDSFNPDHHSGHRRPGPDGLGPKPRTSGWQRLGIYVL